MEFPMTSRNVLVAGTLSVIFSSGTVISMVSLAIIGRFGLRDIYAAMVLFPGIVIEFL